MDYICKICNQKIEGNAHFFNEHRQKISNYFEQFEPRLTKTGQKVLFKNSIEDYLEKDFNSIVERNAWAKENEEVAKEYFLNLLIKRKERKNWVYAPGQILLRLCDLPQVLWFEKKFGKNYNDICKTLGFKIKYSNFDLSVDLKKSIEVRIDSREQLPLNLGEHIKIVNKKLDYGDIALEENLKISIERKSLNDLCGSIGKGYDRLKREFERAKKDEGYIIILCENSFSDFKSIEFLPQTKHVKASYSWLAKRIRDLYLEFDNIQFVFSNGRKHAAQLSEIILKLGKKVKKTDLQLAVDKKII